MELLWGTAARPIGAGPPFGGTGSPAHAAVGAHGAPAGDSSPQMPRAHPPGEGESSLGGGRCPRSACGGRQISLARAHQLGGQGVLPRRRSVSMECLRGTAAPKRPGPTNWGDGESCPGGGRCLWSACGGRLPPSAQAHQLGGWESCSGAGRCPWGTCGGRQPSKRPQNGPGPPAGGTGSPSPVVVDAYGAPAGDGRPHRHVPLARRMGSPAKGRSVPMERLRGTAAPIGPGPPVGGLGVLPRRCSVPMGRLRAAAALKTVRAHQPAGRGVLPRRRSVPVECLWRTVNPISASPPARRTGSPARAAVGACGVLAGDGSPHRRGPTGWGDGESRPGGGRVARAAIDYRPLYALNTKQPLRGLGSPAGGPAPLLGATSPY